MNNKKIGLFIASLRKAKNMTQKELAEKLYISDQAVSKWERGLSMPDIGLIEKLSDYLEVSVSEILKGEKIDNMTNKKSDEIIKTSINFFQKEYFKNKTTLIASIVITSILILGTVFYIFGTVDYIRITNNKKPLFIYHTANVFHEDANRESTEYYGIGYNISLCDNKKSNYVFQLGHKQKNVCYTSLTCSETFTSKNDKHSYDFSFFDNRLYLIKSTYLMPAWMIGDEEVTSKIISEYYDVPGVDTSIKRINETTYEMKQTCNISEILKNHSKYVCQLDYFDQLEVFELTRSDIANYYGDACK